jgi:excisionase family DNA binding protein
MEKEKILFDRKSAAIAISISIRGLDYLIATGKIRARRLGKRILIPRDELERFARKDTERIVPPEKVTK